MINVRICTPITGKNLDEFLTNLGKIQQITSLVELRIDSINKVRPHEIEIIKNHTTREAIFTCRKKNEGGWFIEDESKRIKLLKLGINLMFDYLDVELSTLGKISLPNRRKTKLIISYHNFNETPTDNFLSEIVYQMRQYKPDIIKIATYINDYQDIEKLYRLLVNSVTVDTQIVIVGMGEKGKITRVLAPLLGSYLTYAATPYSQSAPGQIQLDQLKNFYNLLKKMFGIKINLI